MRADEKRISVINIDLRHQQSLADLQDRLGSVGKLHDQQITLGHLQLGEVKDLQRSLGVAQHDAENGAIGQVHYRQGNDVDVRGLEAADNIKKCADPVFHKDIELAHAGPIA